MFPSMREGQACLAFLRNKWDVCTIRRVNEDETCRVELDDDSSSNVLRGWYGVTPAELAFDDAARWHATYDALWGDRAFGPRELDEVLALVGSAPSVETRAAFWTKHAGAAELDRQRAHSLILRAGYCAKQLDEFRAGPREPRYCKPYWNQTRMGGRQPSELGREVTLDDALAAFALDAVTDDPEVHAALDRLETTHAVRIPSSVRTLMTRGGLREAVTQTHPNHPEILGPSELELRRDMRSNGYGGELAIQIMDVIGSFEWAVVFDDGDPDARVYMLGGSPQDKRWLVAPSVGFFFWDLAQTGLCWWQDTRHLGGKRVRQTDIGLALD